MDLKVVESNAFAEHQHYIPRGLPIAPRRSVLEAAKMNATDPSDDSSTASKNQMSIGCPLDAVYCTR